MADLDIVQVVDRPESIAFQADFQGIQPEALFDYFIAPHRLVQWWSQEAVVDARLDGEYTLAWPAMDWELFGKFTTFLRGLRLGYTWKWRHLPELPVRQVEIAFQPIHDGTRILLTHGTYTTGQADQDDRQSHVDGWNHFLRRLQELTAG